MDLYYYNLDGQGYSNGIRKLCFQHNNGDSIPFRL